MFCKSGKSERLKHEAKVAISNYKSGAKWGGLNSL